MSSNNSTWLNKSDRIQRWLGLALAVFGIVAKDVDIRVRICVFIIAICLIIIWFIAVLRENWTKFFQWVCPPKLTKSQKTTLDALIGDTVNLLSTSLTSSPFCVWQNCANTFFDFVRMESDHHSAIHAWWLDIQSLISINKINPISLLPTIYHAHASAYRLAKRASGDLKILLNNESLTKDQKIRLSHEWEIAATVFNGNINRWQAYFQELRVSHNHVPIVFYEPLGSLRS